MIFTKFFSEHDRQSTFRSLKNMDKVVFVDTPATDQLVQLIEELLSLGNEVHVRDHHDVAGEIRSPRDQAIRSNVDKIKVLLGEKAVISNREANPACSSLIKPGEFNSPGTIIVADPDADGLTAAMTAAGVTYPKLSEDAAVLDGPRAAQTKENLSPEAHLLTKAMGSLPAFDASKPEISEGAKSELFEKYVAMIQGDHHARQHLEGMAKNYEVNVARAKAAANSATKLAEGVVLSDLRKSETLDKTTLIQSLERQAGVKVTIIANSQGPIAAKHVGGQYTIAVTRAHQSELNVQDFLAKDFKSSPESGVICNTSFMAHVSQAVFHRDVLPRLKDKLGQNEKPASPQIISKRDQQLVERAKISRQEKEKQRLLKHLQKEANLKHQRGEAAKANLRAKGAFNLQAAEAAPKQAPGQKTNVPGQGPAKGPGGNKQVLVNEKNQAKRERKRAQLKKRGKKR